MEVEYFELVMDTPPEVSADFSVVVRFFGASLRPFCCINITAARLCCSSTLSFNLTEESSPQSVENSIEPDRSQRSRTSFLLFTQTQTQQESERRNKTRAAHDVRGGTKDVFPLICTPPPHQSEGVTGWLLPVIGLPVHCGTAYGGSLM